jgi:hypothetical protein
MNKIFSFNQFRVLLLAVFLLMSAAPQTASVDPVPAARRTNWAYTGVPGGIPQRTKICASFSPGVTAAAVNTALSSCGSSGGGVVELRAGRYTLAGLQVFASNVTLRGAGADQTVLAGGNIVNLGRGYQTPVGISIISGGAKDATTFRVATAQGLAVNQMIEIDKEDDPDVVVSTKGGSRYTRQVNLITAISGTTITVKNPLLTDFGSGNPRIQYTFANTSFSGIEDLKLDHSGVSSNNNLTWQYCYGCWMKGVESFKASGYHMVVQGTLNLELRDSFIHDSQTYGANNAGIAVYGNPLYGSNSSGKIENNIFDRLFPAIQLQNSSSGFYVGYNYAYGSMSDPTSSLVTWTFVDNHGPHNMMNLWEGNIGEMFGSDGYFGGSSHGTVARNYFTGYNPISGARGHPLRLNRLSYYYNLVGNVLGSPPATRLTYEELGENCGGVCNGIYRLGFPNIGNASLTDQTGKPVPGGMAYPDAKVASSLLRWGNYDYSSAALRWTVGELPLGLAVPSERTVPDSYFYTSRPAWFPANVPWPPIGPEVTGGNGDASGHVNKTPAQLCWERRDLKNGGAFSASACYSPTIMPAAPGHLRLMGPQ